MKPSAKSGFALPLVLGMTAILTLTLAVAIVSLRGLREQTLLAIRGADFELAAATAEARLSYLMITEPFGAATLDIGSSRRLGPANQAEAQTPPLSQLYMDGRPYLWREFSADEEDAPYFVAEVQDEAGLVNLYQMDVYQLQRLFERAGLEARDAENLANEVVAYNSDPTLHQPMRRASELFRLEGANELIDDRVWRTLEEKVVVYPDSRAVNINTAPADVLSIWFDLSDTQAEEIVRNREGQVLASTADIGVVVTNSQNYARTGGRLRFRFTDPETRLSYQSSLVFTWNNATRPIWVENPQVIRLSEPPELPEEPEDFPPIPDPAA